MNAVKYVLISLANKLNVVNDYENRNDLLTEEKKSSDVNERLKEALQKCDSGSNENEGRGKTTSIECQIGRELDFFRVVGQRERLLEILYKALMSVLPTSVEAERAFSASGLFLKILRYRLSDEALCKLTCSQHYFQYCQRCQCPEQINVTWP